jgi:outer membrane protein
MNQDQLDQAIRAKGKRQVLRNTDAFVFLVALWMLSIFLQTPLEVSSAENPVAEHVVNLVVAEELDGTRCTVLGDGDIYRYSEFTLRDPLRIVIDIWNVKHNLRSQKYRVKSSEIATIRIGNHSDRVRLVLDIAAGLSAIPPYRLEKDHEKLIAYLGPLAEQVKKEDQLRTSSVETGDVVSQWQSQDSVNASQQKPSEGAAYASRNLKESDPNETLSGGLPELIDPVSISSEDRGPREEDDPEKANVQFANEAIQGTKKLSLGEAIDIALKNNFSVLSAHEAIQEAESVRKSALTDFLPKFSASGSYNWLSETPTFTTPGAPETPVFDVNNREEQIGVIVATPSVTEAVGKQENWVIQGTVTQPLFTGGALVNRYRLARLGVESAETALVRLKQDLSLDVLRAYFNVLNSIEQKKVADQAVKLLESQREVSQEFFNVGMIPKNDLLRTEVQLAEKVRDQISTANFIELRKAELNTILQRPVTTPVELENILEYKPVVFDLEVGIRLGQRNRVEITELDLQIASSEREVSIAQSAFFPQVALNYNLFKTEGTSFAALVEGWSVEAGATWTFWEWGKTYHNVSAARSKVMQDRYQKQSFLDQIALEVKEAYVVLQSAEQNIFVAKKAIEQGEENFRTTQERYKEQVATITDVLDSQTLLTQAQTDYYNALRNFNVAKGALNRAIGLTVYEPLKTSSIH